MRVAGHPLFVEGVARPAAVHLARLPPELHSVFDAARPDALIAYLDSDDRFAPLPDNKAVAEFSATMARLQTVCQAHQKSMFHLFGERGATLAIKKAFCEQRELVESHPLFDPGQIDFDGFTPSDYALAGGHFEAYLLLEEAVRERRSGTLWMRRTTAGAQAALRPASDAVRRAEAEAAVLAYYPAVDAVGEGATPAEKAQLENVLAMFTDEVEYTRSLDKVMRGKTAFRDFYEKERDIVGRHGEVRIQHTNVLPGGAVKVRTSGRFDGVRRSNGAAVRATFEDHFVYLPATKQFALRYSAISAAI